MDIDMKIKRIDVIICLLFYAIFKIYAIPTVVQQATKIAAIAIVGLFLLSRCDRKKLLNISLPFSAAIIISGAYAYMSGINNFKSVMNGILYAVCLYCICTLLLYCRDIDYLDGFLNCFYGMSILYSLISLVFIVMRGGGEGSSVTYFVGNKFATSFLYIMMIILYSIKHDKYIRKGILHKTIFLIMAASSLLISIWVRCSTAVVASFLICVIPFIPEKIKKVLSRPKVIIAAMIVSGIILFSIEKILNIPFVNHIVVDVLKRSATLTGRLTIYRRIWSIVQETPWLGHGYGNGIVQRYIGYGNAQNGMFQIALDYGMIGCIVLLFTVYKCVSRRLEPKYQYLYVLAYAMIITAIVEISFDSIFFIAIYAIYAVGVNEDKTVVKEEGIFAEGKG